MPNEISKQEADQCLVAVKAQIEAGIATCQTVQALINDCQTIKNGHLDDDAYDDFMALFESIRELALMPSAEYRQFKKWDDGDPFAPSFTVVIYGTDQGVLYAGSDWLMNGIDYQDWDAFAEEDVEEDVED